MCMLFSLRNYCAFQLKFYVRTRHIHLASIMSGKENTRKRKGNEEGPVSKKMKIKVEDDAEAGPSSQNSAGVKFTDTSKDFLELINHAREAKAQSVSAFKFNKKRVRVLSTAKEFQEECDGVIYWMSRDQRVQDNWAMLYAQRLALKMEVPLHVVFCLVPKFLEATIRQYGFMLKGLQEVEQECGRLGIMFHLLTGYAKEVLPDFVKCNNIGGVVTDFSPLRVPKQWVKDVTENLPKNIPLCQVDAHNIVPCWEASDKREYGARTIRNKIQSKLPEYLTEFPPVIRHPYAAKTKAEPVDWSAAEASLQIDRTVTEVKWASPGATAGLRTLETFCKERLKFFNADRNNPNKNACSNLSPWIHFGTQVLQVSCMFIVQM
ncbi:deoxyribodipyrimidine photo-lyase-like [Lingula anatina]|uniref:Deoxyribodipyrimidine photo-lyase-like n=1 Tax=Lingula anatina TaxID=7574 RepID=A0A1S3K7R9_LINAN|nr:deoxyribodipyrimidine photo-lyase-like [Lingula anatina]|eukprot:XP_013418542.1 deoxyribodipyrimidine photo-lyase-like [Lingula anatina]